MRERILIVFIAIAIGLLITTLIYFLYQQTKTVPQKTSSSRSSIAEEEASPTPENSGYLKIDQPIDGSISERRLIQVKGSTHAEDTLVVSTNQEDVVAKPTLDGKFSASITIDSGANIIIVRSIAPSGEEKKDMRTVTFSTEEF